MEQNKDTEYGRKYGFANIHSIEEYQKKVPVSVYDDYAGYILRMSEDGEENLITSGKVVHYNKSSGTVGNPKRIPLTEEAFQVFQKYNGPYRMGLVAKELGEDWINGRNMSIAESIAEIQHVKSGVTYGALSVKMIGEFRPYLGMSFTSPDEAIYPESETNTRYLHARFGLMDQDLTNMAANFLGFLLEVLRYMEQHWELLVNDIEQGTIDLGIKMSEEVRSSLLKKIQPMPERAQELRGIFMQGLRNRLYRSCGLMHSSLPVSVPVDLRFMLIRSKRNIWEKK
ncbi:MAG: GH3 auxin-responsive promoter family protein [Ruminococcus sp.]